MYENCEDQPRDPWSLFLRQGENVPRWLAIEGQAGSSSLVAEAWSPERSKDSNFSDLLNCLLMLCEQRYQQLQWTFSIISVFSDIYSSSQDSVSTINGNFPDTVCAQFVHSQCIFSASCSHELLNSPLNFDRNKSFFSTTLWWWNCLQGYCIWFFFCSGSARDGVD